ncbi:UDP-glucose 4-epimerase GalE [Suttonella sp. R2A3]|uniref:UDP-glucose 4-epimerase GalE n=1 Tax=Suttonella sp. R2A3 TaxID=2908648 RepID=UPI001F253B84|nr:UDP-glucose 4-epimerase GalE [Suttonella sp. R2A3]UJF25307.1 UDP-glucose 4-epimerase GalE [Suttonella sp. R2A3]
MMILVTGGAGYIGSHTVLALLDAGYQVLVLDNLANSSREAIHRVEQISGAEVAFVEGDVRDRALLGQLFADYDFSAVMHFAGLKAVGESVEKPLMYFDNNVGGSIHLLEAMKVAGVKRFVFSSSATVYGEPAEMPISERCPTARPTNPYGLSKLMVEQVMQELSVAEPDWQMAALRYFNPVGAHESGLIGEDPSDIPNNLVPYISKVAIGELVQLSVFGDDYNTPDGTGVRDYIHVLDLAQGHVDALRYLEKEAGLHVWNLGTGNGYSVLEMVAAFEVASGQAVPYQIVPRRAGDIATCYADSHKAATELGWRAERDLNAMMTDTWRWQSNNPKGYRG